jgi:hypothetical protein
MDKEWMGGRGEMDKVFFFCEIDNDSPVQSLEGLV